MNDNLELGKYGKAHINGRAYGITTYGTIKSINGNMITFIDNLDKKFVVAEKDFKFSPIIQGDEKHIELIRCPECEKVQNAEVEHTLPFWTYLHICECGNLIMESDWETVNIEAK